MDSTKLFGLEFGKFMKDIKNMKSEDLITLLCYAHGWINSSMRKATKK